MPRAYDRLVPPVDKDPNRFGTDYSDPLSAVSDAAAVAGEQIRDQLVQIIMDKTGIDLSGPVAFIDWLGKQINVALGDLAATLAGIVAPLFQTIEQLLDLIKAAIGVDLRTVVANLQDLLDGLANLFGLSGVGKSPAEAVTAIGAWLANTFQGVSNGLAAIVKTVTDLIDGFFKLFGGTGTVSLTTMLTAATAWMAQWQAFLDGVWNAFTGGVAGAGKTVAEALKSVTDWLSNIFQALLDEIAKLLPFELGGWRPGSGAANLHAGIQDVVNSIAGILGIGQKAAAAAGEANLAISVITSAQAGGFHDELDYTLADDMPAGWQKKTPLADSYGPDGKGGIRGVMRGVLGSISATGPVQYVQTGKPLTTADMKVTTQLLRKPWWGGFPVPVNSSWYLLVQANPADRSAYGVQIKNDRCQFFSLDTAGNQTNIGTAKTIPANATNIPYILEIKGTTLKLTIGSVTAATQAVSAPLTGRCIGFGGEKVVFANPSGDNPLAQFSGFTWQPAT